MPLYRMRTRCTATRPTNTQGSSTTCTMKNRVSVTSEMISPPRRRIRRYSPTTGVAAAISVPTVVPQ